MVGWERGESFPDGRCELDSHADTCCLGSNFAVTYYTGQQVAVRPFSSDYKPMRNVQVVTGETAYDCPDGSVVLLVVHQGLYMGKRTKVSLLNPNQMRDNGVRVDDCPTQFDPKSPHALVVPKLEFPLRLDFVDNVSFLRTRLPTAEEQRDCERFELTSDAVWDPHSDKLAEQEAAARRRADAQRRLPDLIGGRTVRALESVDDLPVVSDDENSDGEEDDPVLTFPDRVINAVIVECPDDGGGAAEYGNDDGADVRTSGALKTVSKRSTGITAKQLSENWNIGLKRAQNTLRVTTQAGVRRTAGPITQRFRTRQSHLRYPRLRTTFYSDTMFAKQASLGGHKCAQVFTSAEGFSLFYPMHSKAEAGSALGQAIHDAGVMDDLVTDNAKEELGAKWGELVSAYHIRQRTTEPYTSWQNRAEAEIKRIKGDIRYHTNRRRSPKRLWNYLGAWVADIRRVTANTDLGSAGRTPHEIVHGDTPDISDLISFDWYEDVFYHVGPTEHDAFPQEREALGKWIGVARTVGQRLTFYVLTEKGSVIARSTVRHLTEVERTDPKVKQRIADLQAAIEAKIGDSLAADEVDPGAIGAPIEVIFDGDELPGTADDPYTRDDKPEDDEFTPEAYDQYIAAHVLLPRGDSVLKAKVVARSKDGDGNPVGRRNANPILDTREYEVEFPDGATEVYTANVIAQNIYASVDENGMEYLVLDEIVGHRKDGHAVAKDDEFIKLAGRSNPSQRRTTKGWELEVRWKDGSTTWVPLRNIKDSHPVEVAEYAVANKIASEPAFSWWVRHALRQRDRVIKAVRKAKSKYWSKTHKYGIELPKTVKEALEIDKRTGTDFWRRAIEKEMRNVMVAFEILEDGTDVPPGYQHIKCHLVFDVKMDLTRKARLVAGGHETEPTKDATYSSVVSRESVRLAFTVAALNGLDILAADIQNAYLNAMTKEKVYTTAGLEFGVENVGKKVLIVRALYGLRTSGARFRAHLAQCLRDAGYVSSKADPDVWLKAATKSDGTEYYSYVLCYVDDVLVIDERPEVMIELLRQTYKLKDGSVGPPTSYLGADVKEHYIPNSSEPGKKRWAMSANGYIKRALADVETKLGSRGLKLPKRAASPLTPGYAPELDQTGELDDDDHSWYMGLIGVLRWIVELGRVDICVDVTKMSSFMAMPRQGHLEQVLHIFAYLKAAPKHWMVFDDTEPSIDERRFLQCDWSEYYPDTAEAVPDNAPAPRGRSMKLHCFVDASHAGCRVTRRSHSGVVVFANRAPILWYSKKQSTVESSTFSSELVAMRLALEMVEGLRYRLRMMGIPLEGPTNMFCDNSGVVANTTAPESTLKKKHNAINYHRVREAVAAKVIRIAKEGTATNIADLLTKSLPAHVLRDMVTRILW